MSQCIFKNKINSVSAKFSPYIEYSFYWFPLPGRQKTCGLYTAILIFLLQPTAIQKLNLFYCAYLINVSYKTCVCATLLLVTYECVCANRDTSELWFSFTSENGYSHK